MFYWESKIYIYTGETPAKDQLYITQNSFPLFEVQT